MVSKYTHTQRKEIEKQRKERQSDTYSTPYSTDHLLVKEFTALGKSQRFITVMIRARRPSQSRAKRIKPTFSHTISLRLVLILSSHLGLSLPNVLFPSGHINFFSNKKFISIRQVQVYIPDVVKNKQRFPWVQALSGKNLGSGLGRLSPSTCLSAHISHYFTILPDKV
jgi:hypothetical protein